MANYCYPDYPICDCNNSDAKTFDQYQTGLKLICRQSYNWELEKSVDKDSWELFEGDQAKVWYTLSAKKNLASTKYYMNAVLHVVSGAQKCPIIIDRIQVRVTRWANADGDLVSGAPFDLPLPEGQDYWIIAPGETLLVPYEIEVPDYQPGPGDDPDIPPGYCSHVFFRIINHAGEFPVLEKRSQKECVRWPTTCEQIDGGSVLLVDELLGVNELISDSTDLKVCKILSCDDVRRTGGTYTNLARLIRPSDNSTLAIASRNVYIVCRRLVVSKDARTKFTREWKWDVTKTADLDELILQQNQIGSVNYTVNVDGVFEDRDLLVLGDINIYNPAGIPAEIKIVQDEVSANGLLVDAVVDCMQNFIISANSNHTCPYSVSVDSKVYNLNTAVVVQQNHLYSVLEAPVKIGSIAYSATALVDFGSANISRINQCVVYDDNGDNLEAKVICAPLMPDSNVHEKFTYARDFTAPVCPEENYVFVNTVNVSVLPENGGGLLDEASHTITVRISCSAGCALTIGYWKTHSTAGPARWPDETWDLITPNAQNSAFYLSQQSWLKVAQEAPRGNVYYVLAHQFIAAKLNQMAGASSVPEVDACLAFAEQFFHTYTPALAAKLSPKKADRKQALECAQILDSYNNGLLPGGPGHCTEQVV